MRRRNYIKVFMSIILAILVVLGDAVVLVYNNVDNSNNNIAYQADLENFEKLNLIDIQNNYNKYYLKYNKVDKATRYVIEIIKLDEVISNVEVTNEEAELIIPVNYLKNDEKYTLNVSAYHQDKLLQTIDNVEIKWNEPSISSSNSKSIKNKKYTLKIDGELDKDHRLVIKNGKKILYDKKITKNTFIVPSKIYMNKKITLDFMLYSNDTLLSSFRAKNDYKVVTTTKKVTTKVTTTKKIKNDITNINIKKPSSYLSLSEIKDVVVEFKGGDNSKEKNIYIYENNKLIKKDSLLENNYVISASLFKEGNMYKVTIEASKDKTKKSSTIYISTIKDGRKKMVELAKKQLGNSGNKYWTWWGFKFRVEWCAIFVSWISNQNHYIEAGVLPKIKGCGSGVKWFKERKQFKLRTSGYVPKQGDIIFFDYHPENAVIDHVGIVEYSDSNYVYTIEGNTGERPNTKVLRKKYAINDETIYGYGVPNY